MKTPLYKKLKPNGNTTFTFPSAVDDISNAKRNDTYDAYFSKFVLINLPKQKISNDEILDYRSGKQFSVNVTKTVPLEIGSATVTDKEAVVFDFDNAFYKNNLGSIQSASTFSDQLVESLRNYVANHEVMIRNTKTNDNKYFFDTSILKTPTERIFFKWAKKLNLIQFDVASGNDDYFDTLSEFERNNTADDSYLKEYLWKERVVIDYTPDTFDTSNSPYTNLLQATYTTHTNYRVGDIVEFYNFQNDASVAQAIHDLTSIPYSLDTYTIKLEVLSVTSPVGNPQTVVFDASYTTSPINNTNIKTKLVYNKFVKYVGEITNFNTVKKADGSYTQIISHISANQGQTPDVLFRTLHDNNYEPNLAFPILPQQFQPEILGAENSLSSIITTPSLYAGDYYASYDKDNNDDAYNYLSASGDILRRTGDFFGVTGDINSKTFNPNKLDGISIDFNPNHYVKMNLSGSQVSNFDDFNGLAINNEPPQDFEFNAILWYYTIVDANGNSSTNMYGVQILDNPNNNPNDALIGLQVPTFKKYVNDGVQDGNSYQYDLRYEYDMDDENYIPTYDPSNIYNLYSFDLYNEAMRQLAQANGSFFSLINNYNTLSSQIATIKQLVYNQQDIANINKQLKDLQDLLKLYQTLQLSESDTIYFTDDLSTTPPTLKVNSKDQVYNKIEDIYTTSLYSAGNTTPYSVNVVLAKNFLIRVINDDVTNVTLTNTNKLTIILDRDLDYKQSVDIEIYSTDIATQNKKLDLFINYDSGVVTTPIIIKLIKTIDLPVGFNIVNNKISLANKLKNNIYLNIQKIIAKSNNTINIYTIDNANSITTGEYLYINNFIKTSTTSDIDYSNLYYIENVTTNAIPNFPTYVKETIITLNVANNIDLVSYLSTLNINDELNINNSCYANLLKKWKLKITRVDDSTTSSFDDRYYIDIVK